MHRPRPQRLAWIALLAGAAACGARSQLVPGDGDGDGGAGPTSSSSSTTTTTSGGGGGAGGAGGEGGCGALTPLEIATIAGGEDFHQRKPALTFASGDAARVTLVSAWEVVEGPATPPVELRHTTFEPWGDWPGGAALGPTFLADLDAGTTFAAARAGGDRLALLFADFQEPPAGGLRFSTDFVPGSGDVPPSALVHPGAQAAVFAVESVDRHFVGTSSPTPTGGELLELAVLDDGPLGGFSWYGCGLGPPKAAAVPTASGAVFAYATQPFSDCLVDPPAPPTDLWVGYVDEPGFGAQLQVSEGALITDVGVAPRSNGAWVVWRADLNGSPRISAAPASSSGVLNDGLFFVTQPGDAPSPGTMAVAGFEDHLAVAWWQPQGVGGFLRVRLLAPDGSLVAERDIELDVPPGQSPAITGRPAFLGAPAGKAALLAWSQSLAEGDRLQLTRLDCLD